MVTRAIARRRSAGRQSGERRMASLRVSEGFKSFVLDQLAAVDDLAPKAMFGGVGLYCEGLFFGIIAGDVLHLKADDTNRPDYEHAGATPFRPYADRTGTMQYYAVPIAVLESEPELIAWVRKAVAAAERAAYAASGRKRRARGRKPPRSRTSH